MLRKRRWPAAAAPLAPARGQECCNPRCSCSTMPLCVASVHMHPGSVTVSTHWSKGEIEISAGGPALTPVILSRCRCAGYTSVWCHIVSIPHVCVCVPALLFAWPSSLPKKTCWLDNALRATLCDTLSPCTCLLIDKCIFAKQPMESVVCWTFKFLLPLH